MSKYVQGLKPLIFKSRSKFDLSHRHVTSMNVGDLCPLYIQEVLPGDTLKVTSHNVFRASTPFLKPVMDNLFLDMYYFFVPLRLIWDKSKSFFGENTEGYWTNQEIVEHPTISGNVGVGTIADYLGIPPFNYSSGNYRAFNELPFRAYALVWNEWFRDQNTQEPVFISKSSGASRQSLNSNTFNADNIFGKCAKINKLHDYFTSCLPAPQKGEAVTLKFGNDAKVQDLINTGGTASNLKTSSGGNSLLENANGDDVFINLAGLNIANVNDLRLAFALQRMLEKDARGGTRYIEYIQEHFGVTNPDYRLQRPEYLGGKRMPLNIQQVASTAQTDLKLGDLAGYSLSNGSCGFNKGFTEHGFVIGVGAIRYKHTYQQGLERFWTYNKRTDYYDPVFANIGEQPVHKFELDVQSAGTGQAIFGYNEAWAHLRFKPNRVSGQMRTASGSGLDIWHFGDTYVNAPSLTSAFIQETGVFVDRTLSSPSSTIANFICDFYHNVEAIRCLPTYSIPGLIDHK